MPKNVGLRKKPRDQNPETVCSAPHACRGVAFDSVAVAQQFMDNAKACSGLYVSVELSLGVYPPGIKCADAFLENTKLFPPDSNPDLGS